MAKKTAAEKTIEEATVVEVGAVESIPDTSVGPENEGVETAEAVNEITVISSDGTVVATIGVGQIEQTPVATESPVHTVTVTITLSPAERDLATLIEARKIQRDPARLMAVKTIAGGKDIGC